MEWWEALRADDALFFGFLGVFGLMCGSFASAAIFRIPHPELTIWRPRRSFCTRCNATIGWYDNLPVLSWFLLRGRCRHCGVRYGFGYVVNELAVTGLFLLAGTTWVAESPFSMALTMVALTSMWIATVIDWHHFILPDGITKGGMAFGVVASLIVPRFQGVSPGADLPWPTGSLPFLDAESAPWLVALMASAIGLVGMFLLVVGIRSLFSYLLAQEALGFGDVKYLAAVGALMGIDDALLALILGVFAGALLGVLNVVRMVWLVGQRRRSRGRRKSFGDTLHTGWLLGRRIPFGPALVLGTVVVLLYPDWPRHFIFEVWPNLFR